MPDRHDRQPALSGADADALDALVEAGFDPLAVAPFQRERAMRLASLLGLLETDARIATDAITDHASRSRLIESTLEASSDRRNAAPDLSHTDAEALDALVNAGWEVSATPSVHRARAAGVASLLSSLDHAQHGAAADGERSRESLIDAAVAGVQSAARRDRLHPVTGAGVGRTHGFRLWDLVSMAAMVLIGVSIMWPMMTSTREGSREAACQTSLQNAGLGFSLYAGDNRGELPRAKGSLVGLGQGLRQWWSVGDPVHSNSANLFVLVTQGYATLADLSCAGNPGAPIKLDLTTQRDWRNRDEVSYSYQLFGRQVARWEGPVRIVVLVDKSPVVQRAMRGEQIDPEARSHNHRGRGQSVLFSDGAVEWLTRPVLADGDNIWLPRSATGRPGVTLQGAERPDDPADAFVGP